MSFTRVPSEFSLDWVYFPPFLITVTVGYFTAIVVAKLLNVTGLSRYLWNPGLAFISLWVLFTSLVGLTFIPP